MPRGVETEREKIADEVVGLAAGREDRPNAARLDDGDVAADRISPQDPTDPSSKGHVAVRRTERTSDDDVDDCPFARRDASTHGTRIDDARPDRGCAPGRELRVRDQPFERVGHVAGTARGGVVA